MKKLTINGMHCHKCVERCERALNAIEGVNAMVDLDSKTAIVNVEVSDEVLKETISDLGFEVVSIE